MSSCNEFPRISKSRRLLLYDRNDDNDGELTGDYLPLSSLTKDEEKREERRKNNSCVFRGRISESGAEKKKNWCFFGGRIFYKIVRDLVPADLLGH